MADASLSNPDGSDRQLTQVVLQQRLSRRSVLATTLAGAGVGGILPWLSTTARADSSRARHRSLILLWQDGGASHLETFDPKPLAPSEYRGELDAIPTALTGEAYCEVLPRLAALADRTSIIRSLHQPSSDHVVGSHNVLTGWYNESDGGRSRYPDFASVISRMRHVARSGGPTIGESTDPRLALGMRGRTGPSSDPHALPGYVDVSKGLHRGGPAFLGPLHAPFQIAGDPSKPGFVVRNLQSSGSGMRLQQREQMLHQLDLLGHFRDGTRPEQITAFEGFHRQAFELLSGSGATRAFDLTREQPHVRERYGRHLAGQQCLLARRLVEAGIDIVAVRFSPDGRGDYDRTMIGWDDHAVHGNIFAIMKKRGPQFDQAVSALIEDLENRGMRDDVLVVVVGEFGRTPRVHVHKGCPGREHWGPAGCALVYGGGLQMGQIIGSTNDKGERPQDRPVSYQDLLATIYRAMGVNPDHTLINHAGRPVPILSTGQPITELIGADQSDGRPPSTTARLSSSQPSSATASDRSALTLPPGATAEALLRHHDLAGLTTLTARDSAFTDRDLEHLSGCPNLRRLELNGAGITDAGLAHLSHLTQLQQLNLTGTRTTGAGLQQLQPLRQLNRIAFDCTEIALTDVVRLIVRQQQRSLITALSAMDLITRNAAGEVTAINVAGTDFGDEELQHLEQLPALQELHLAGTQVTDAGLSVLAQVPRLQELYLAKCGVTDEGMQHIAPLSQLTAINLYGTGITSAGLEYLMPLSELRLLMITDVKLQPAVVDRLKAQHPRLTVTDYTPV